MKKRNKLLLTGITVAGVALGVVIVRVFWPQPNVLDIATRLPDDIPPRIKGSLWLTNALNLAVSNFTMADYVFPLGAPRHQTAEVSVNDVTTGQIAPLNELNSWLRSHGMIALQGEALSNDRDRLFAVAQGNDEATYTLICCTGLKSNHLHTIAIAKVDRVWGPLVPLPDNRRVFAMCVGSKLFNGGLVFDSETTPRPIPVRLADPRSVIGITRDNRLLSLEERGQQPLAITATSLDRAKPTSASTPVELPDGESVAHVMLNPNGKRLAWITYSQRYPPFYPLLKRFAPATAAKTVPTNIGSVFVSRLDGSGLKLIGIETESRDHEKAFIHGWHWRADGAGLRFLCWFGVKNGPLVSITKKERLYEIPVPD